VNGTCHSINGGSFEITHTVPLKYRGIKTEPTFPLPPRSKNCAIEIGTGLRVAYSLFNKVLIFPGLSLET